MEKAITIVNDTCKLNIQDIDEDNEVGITLFNRDGITNIYLNKDNIIAIKNHLEYLINKYNK